MRRALLIGCVVLLAAGAALADATRTLKVELSGDPTAQFKVENLAGAMTVVAGDGSKVVAVATVHAESDSIAEAVRFEQVRGESGEPTLRVIYPSRAGHVIRYRSGGTAEDGDRHHGHGWIIGIGWVGGDSGIEYDGRRYQVSSSRGTEVWADVEVRVPRARISGTFRNPVGSLRAEGIEGDILLDTGSAPVTASHLSGHVKADTGSGEVRGSDLRGSFRCDTGSGGCVIVRFDGEKLECDTGSGDVHISDCKAERLSADTGSGHVRVENADVEDFRGDTGSGGVEAELTGTRIRRVAADTGSGDVVLRLPADATFDVDADQGSGDLDCSFQDARPVKSGREIVGYRRGDGRVHISIDTGSGDARIEPLR